MKIKGSNIKSQIIYIIGALWFLMNVISSCGRPSKYPKNIFHYNETTGIATLDPAFAKNQSVIWAVHQIFNTLVETNDDLNIVPSLSDQWQVSADRKTYIFHIRQDVYFHNNPVFKNGKGRKMTAHDIEYSFRRIIDPAVASSGAWIFNGTINPKEPFKALNDSLFKLELRQPFNPVLGLLSMQYCSIVPREVVEYYGKDFRNHACGTGPFQFKAWEEGQALILAKNENYFEKDSTGRRLPYLEAVKVSFFDNKATEFLMFQQGVIDFQNDIDASFKDEVLSKKGVLRKEWQSRIVLSKHPYLNTEYLGMIVDSSFASVKDSPLRLLKIRQAINYGFDRKKMILYLRNSIGIPAESGFVPAGLPSYDTAAVKGFNYQPERARKLVKEAGFSREHPFPQVRLLTIAIYADLGSFIARELEEIGIKVQVEVVQKSLLLEQTAKSEAPFFRGSWIADYPDAENYLSVFYSKNPAPPNYTRFSNKNFDALYEQALIEENDSVKIKLYQQMDRLIISQAPVVPLWYDEVIRLTNPRVKNFRANGLNLLELRTVYIDTVVAK